MPVTREDTIYALVKALGYNVGVKYAKNQLKSDWVIILNTDVVIRQKDFCEKLVEVYNKEHYFFS